VPPVVRISVPSSLNFWHGHQESQRHSISFFLKHDIDGQVFPLTSTHPTVVGLPGSPGSEPTISTLPMSQVNCRFLQKDSNTRTMKQELLPLISLDISFDIGVLNLTKPKCLLVNSRISFDFQRKFPSTDFLRDWLPLKVFSSRGTGGIFLEVFPFNFRRLSTGFSTTTDW